MVLGVRCDKKTTAMEQMFSPNLMMYQLDTLTLSDCGQALVESHQQILQETRTPLHRSISPTVTFWCLFVVVLSFTISDWAKHWNHGYGHFCNNWSERISKANSDDTFII